MAEYAPLPTLVYHQTIENVGPSPIQSIGIDLRILIALGVPERSQVTDQQISEEYNQHLGDFTVGSAPSVRQTARLKPSSMRAD